MWVRIRKDAGLQHLLGAVGQRSQLGLVEQARQLGVQWPSLLQLRPQASQVRGYLGGQSKAGKLPDDNIW